jgi:cytosine/adenosine deaminase-related metal-dependent hydrolase
LIRVRASWIVPIHQPPIRDGWVDVEEDRIVALGPGSSVVQDAARVRDLGQVAVMPGLVNAHAHLELSYLHGAVPAGSSFVDWIRTLLAARRRGAPPESPEVFHSAREAIAQMVRCGTALVGDISNSMATYAALAESRLGGVAFCEVIGFNPADPDGLVAGALRRVGSLPCSDRLKTSVAAHAPYSVSPQVFHAIRRAMREGSVCVSSVHVAESSEETEFIRTGRGPWRVLLEELAAWNPSWAVPGRTPVEYLDDLGFFGPEVLAVHGVQLSAADLTRLASRQITLVACPRSNEWTRAGTPPIARFYESGVRVAIGTDSLASVPDLNLFSELAAMRTLGPGVPARALLESATRNGARALGFTDHGTIAVGQRARLIAVDVPAGTNDVEEYLVSGIAPGQVHWLQ